MAVLPNDVAEGQRTTAVRAEVETARQPARDPASGGQVGRATVRTTLEAVRRGLHQASRTAIDAPMRAASPTRLTATQASRKLPLTRSTGIHAQAERQIRRIASAVVTTSSGAPITTHSLISRLSSGTPRFSAVMATKPQMRTGTDRLM